MFRKTSILAILLIFVTSSGYCGEISVSAAISLKNAFEEIGRIYEQINNGEKIIFNFGASGDLKKQIEGGAPVDVFAPASQKDMNDLSEKGLIIKDSRINFASNSIVLVKPSGSVGKISSFDDLAKPEIKKICIGNPATVPAGKYAKEVLTHFDLWKKLETKTVLSENVRQALDYVVRNEVDAGIVYETDAMSVPKGVIVAVKAPADSHSPVIYPAALVAASQNQGASKKFLDILVTEKAVEILKKHGFSPVQ
ncbi:molybdate ABC transporter substrate-binding protein [Desulforegula conservatrix]|uniref:molybdate ABC transporter substrate-binding protein n=1 Tax=Desulforegula conservatrix TaxID=153026 RepID=UPI00041DD8C3|nr:molybdate ABC transporter substrate-binding protein [Desulforegula conservatrix]